MEQSQSLSRFDSASTEDLQVVADNVKEYIKSENENVLATITDKLNARPGLIGALFPNKIQKEHDRLTVQKMKNLFEAQENILAVYTNTKIELARKAGDMMIKAKIQQYEGELSARAMQIQADLTAFAQTKINEMSETFEKSRIPFGARRKRQLFDAEQYRNDDFYYNSLKKNLDYETRLFFDTIEELLNGFKDALKNRLDQK